jgi:hypothetical protein
MITSNVLSPIAVTSLKLTNMKQIIHLGSNRYIHLDSYNEYNETPLAKFVMTTLVLAIAAITAGAVAGIDITNIKPTPTQHQTK